MAPIVTERDTGLKVLYEAAEPELASNPQTIDIVAIHGIGAHPDQTWCKHVSTNENGKEYVNWLKDVHMLPSVVPTARIMRYGYESQWFGAEAIRQNASTVAMRFLLSLKRARKEFPFRPLIFIAHCFGGLVILKALLEAQQDPDQWPGIFHSTAGLIFLGTPFRGAEGMSQSEMIQAALREYEPEHVQNEVLRILEPGNEFLQDLVDGFGKTRSGPNKAQVACFYELKPSNVGAIVGGQARTRFVVSRDSGCLDTSDSNKTFSLARTHFNMNKFGSPTEEDFQTVCEVVIGMVENAPGLLLCRSSNGRKNDFSPNRQPPECAAEALQLKRYHEEGRTAYDARDGRLAVQLFNKALEGRERLLGLDADDTVESRRCYADALYMSGNYESAKELFTSLLFRAERKFGPDHIQTLQQRRSLGYAQEKCGHKDAARKQFNLAAQGFEMASQGKDTIDSLLCRYAQGLLASKGEPYDATWPHWPEAEESLQRAARGLSRLLGAKDEQSFQAQLEYARVLLKMRKDYAALDQFNFALSIAKARSMSQNHIQQIEGYIKECKFWLGHKHAQSPDRLAIARTRVAKSKMQQIRRIETGHWSSPKLKLSTADAGLLALLD